MSFSKGLAFGAATGFVLGLGLFSDFNTVAPPPVDPASLITDSLLDKIAMAESHGRADAYNPKTGARGKYQWTPKTFLEDLYKHGSSIGYSRAARQVEREPLRDGQQRIIGYDYHVPDPVQRHRISKLPQKNTHLARELTRAALIHNVAQVQSEIQPLKRDWAQTDIYLIHHFGVSGAARILTAMTQNPAAKFRNAVRPAVCGKNPTLCYDGGKPRSIAETYGILTGLLNQPAPLSSAETPGIALE